MAQFDRFYTTFYWSTIVCIALCCTIFELFDLEIWVRGHSRSLKLVPFESLGAVPIRLPWLYYGSIWRHFRDKARYWSKIVILYPLAFDAFVRGLPVGVLLSRFVWEN